MTDDESDLVSEFKRSVGYVELATFLGKEPKDAADEEWVAAAKRWRAWRERLREVPGHLEP